MLRGSIMISFTVHSTRSALSSKASLQGKILKKLRANSEYLLRSHLVDRTGFGQVATLCVIKVLDLFASLKQNKPSSYRQIEKSSLVVCCEIWLSQVVYTPLLLGARPRLLSKHAKYWLKKHDNLF